MYCRKCGNELRPLARFCGKCGIEIETRPEQILRRTVIIPREQPPIPPPEPPRSPSKPIRPKEEVIILPIGELSSQSQAKQNLPESEPLSKPQPAPQLQSVSKPESVSKPQPVSRPEPKPEPKVEIVSSLPPSLKEASSSKKLPEGPSSISLRSQNSVPQSLSRQTEAKPFFTQTLSGVSNRQHKRLIAIVPLFLLIVILVFVFAYIAAR